MHDLLTTTSASLVTLMLVPINAVSGSWPVRPSEAGRSGRISDDNATYGSFADHEHGFAVL